MAPLPVSNTQRIWVDYRYRGRISTVLYRIGEFDELPPFMEGLAGVHDDLKGFFCNNWEVVRARWAQAGDNISTPIELASAGTIGTHGPDDASIPDSQQIQVVGRDHVGRRTFYYYQGVFVGTVQNQRFFAGASPMAEAFRLTHESLVPLGLSTISGQNSLSIYPYVNQVFNDYLTHKSRRG